MDLENWTIEKTEDLKQAIIKINQNKKRFLIVINDVNNIVGILSDGDIRRALLNDVSIDDKVEKIYAKKFEYLTIQSTFDEVCDKFKIRKIDFLPIVDAGMKLINILTKDQFHLLLVNDARFDLKQDYSVYDTKIIEHEVYNRPWGFYKTTMLTPHAQGKIITVFSNSELSLQEHKKREEHWVIIKGKGIVILGESVLDVHPGKYIYIPKGCKHQIINNSDEELIFSEVQLGEYFGEDDIIRYSDKYGRT